MSLLSSMCVRGAGCYSRCVAPSSLCVAPSSLCVATSPIQRRCKQTKPEFRWLRARKMIKVELPDMDEEPSQDQIDAPDQIRRRLKKLGMLPSRHWSELPLTVTSTGGIFEPYLPPEGDGRMSLLSTAGAKQKVQVFGKKSASYFSVRKIRSFDEDFSVADFPEQALEIYKRAHQALTEMDEDVLHATVTELAYPKMTAQVALKTIRWQLLKQLEPGRCVHVRHTTLGDKQNVFAQVTVRLHTQQLLAVYDRFGRLMYGSEAVAKDVLEYVVFEKHLAGQYSNWRIHDKIVPDWMPPREPVMRTWVRQERDSETDEEQQTTAPETAASAAVSA